MISQVFQFSKKLALDSAFLAVLVAYAVSIAETPDQAKEKQAFFRYGEIAEQGIIK
jgi:hypothetical protein